MDLGLRGKRALVIGGSTGIGFAIARELSREGAGLTIASRNPEHLADAKRDLGGDVGTLVMDLMDESSVRTSVAKMLGEGAIDILVINTGGPASGPVLNIDLAGWDRGYQSLVRSVVLLCQLVVPGMRERKWGRILTVTSTSAKEILPMLPVSATFRAGLSAYAKQLAKEIGRDGILINNLLPGPTRTGRLDELKQKNPALLDMFKSESALGRLAEPEEIARAAAFYLSQANSYATGTDILVDGGFTKAF